MRLMMWNGVYNMIEMKLSEMDEWMVGVNDVVEESGVWRFLLDDDCIVIMVSM